MELELNSEDKIVPDAFHGTCADSAEKIIREGKFRVSSRPGYYLGDGVYFYESSCWHARNWGKLKCSRQGKKWVVFVAILNLKNCLDLHNRKHVESIQRIAGKLKARTGEVLNDSIVINYICSTNPNIGSVRATFFKLDQKNHIFEGSHFLDYNQLIICIKDTSKIVKFREKEREC